VATVPAQGNDATGALAPIPRLGLSLDEAGAALGMSRDSFDRYIAPHIRIVRLGRMRIVPVSELARYVDEHAEHVLGESR
jgi:hypothetical protein